MKRTILLAVAAVGAFAGCAQALAAATTQANVSIDIAAPSAGITIVSPLVLPTISTTAVVPSSSFSTSGTTSVGVPGVSGNGFAATNGPGQTGGPGSNATLTIYGQSGGAVSMAVPETFEVIRTGGTETLTVKTNTNSDLAGNGVVLGGTPGSDSMSINVGGSLALASADPLVPGPYEGLLVVVVQYN
jgi:hypothetical protein